jgi:hypothetical protein
MTRLRERIMHLLKAAPWTVRDMGTYFPEFQAHSMHTSTVGELLRILSMQIVSLEMNVHDVTRRLDGSDAANRDQLLHVGTP